MMLDIKDNGSAKAKLEMAEELLSGKMVVGMMASLVKAKPMAEEESYMHKEMYMKVNGLKTMYRVMEYKKLLMEANMKACGKKIFSMGTGKNYGQMVQRMKAIMKKV